MFKRILVPIDESQPSSDAQAVALRLSRAFGAQLRLVHWLDVRAFPNMRGNGEPLIRLAQEYAESLLESRKAQAQADGVAVETHLVLARGRRLGDCIREDAQEWDADAIVLASHGRKGVARVLLGSGAEQIIRESPVPALVVRGAGPAALFRRILVAVDGSEVSAQALNVAIELARSCGARVRIVHSIGDLAVFGAYGYAHAFLEQVRIDADRVLQDAAALAKAAGVDVQTCLAAGDEGLGTFVAQQVGEWEADLIVAGTHGRRGFRRAMLGSGAEQIARQAPTSVLLVPGADAAARHLSEPSLPQPERNVP
jgi:nucleotide-binding universal stress UspA family protein